MVEGRVGDDAPDAAGATPVVDGQRVDLLGHSLRGIGFEPALAQLAALDQCRVAPQHGAHGDHLRPLLLPILSNGVPDKINAASDQRVAERPRLRAGHAAEPERLTLVQVVGEGAQDAAAVEVEERVVAGGPRDQGHELQWLWDIIALVGEVEGAGGVALQRVSAVFAADGPVVRRLGRDLGFSSPLA